MTRSVAFFRFMNLGHRGSPVRTQLVDAFEASGASEVVSFQTNGTVVFTADAPVTTAAAARDLLEAEVGYTHPVMVCPLDTLREIAAFTPLPDGPAFAEYCVSFFDPFDPLPDIPRSSANGLTEIVLLGTDHAVAGVHRVDNRMGDPNGHLETQLKVAVTTRTLGTVRRLVAKFAPPDVHHH